MSDKTVGCHGLVMLSVVVTLKRQFFYADLFVPALWNIL